MSSNWNNNKQRETRNQILLLDSFSSTRHHAPHPSCIIWWRKKIFNKPRSRIFFFSSLIFFSLHWMFFYFVHSIGLNGKREKKNGPIYWFFFSLFLLPSRLSTHSFIHSLNIYTYKVYLVTNIYIFIILLLYAAMLRFEIFFLLLLLLFCSTLIESL